MSNQTNNPFVYIYYQVCTTSDLMAGAFEHDAIMQLIATRCARVITILTPNFFQSRANKFFVSFSQFIGIEMGMRKIIPCVFRPCQIPYNLYHLVRLTYNSFSQDNHTFWERLGCSLPKYSTINILQQGNSKSIAPSTPSPPITSALAKTTFSSIELPINSLNAQHMPTNRYVSQISFY